LNADDESIKAVALQKYLLLHSQHDELVRRIRASPSSSSAASSASSSPTTRILEEKDDEEQLLSINSQIRDILTELLDCVSGQNDPNFRAWVRLRLVETEQELQISRK
jgi:hypothetical protein